VCWISQVVTREIEPITESEKRIIRLKRPSLEDVRTFEVGKFLKKGGRIKGSGEIKSIREIKSLVHPKWFEEEAYTNAEKWSISQKTFDYIKKDKKVRRRWRTVKIWVKKEKSKTGKGYWAKRIRAPKKAHWKWVPYSKLTKEQKGKPGRKTGGMSYKIRREIWKLIASPGLILNLLKDENLSGIERGPIYKTKKSSGKSIPTPHLENAVREMIEKEIWPKLDSHKMRIAKEWCEHPNFKRSLDLEQREAFIEGKLDSEDELKIIRFICKKSWRVILINWLELKIYSENLFKDKEAMYSIYSKQYDNVDSDEGDYEIIVQDDRCDCGYWIELEDEKDIWCGTCGLVISDFRFSTNEEEEKRR